MQEMQFNDCFIISAAGLHQLMWQLCHDRPSTGGWIEKFNLQSGISRGSYVDMAEKAVLTVERCLVFPVIQQIP